MAKFKIVVCILLVTCGAQGALLSSITSTATSALSSVVSSATAQVATVETTVDSLSNTTANVTELVNNAVANATAEYTETVASIVATASSVVDVTSCLSLSTDFEKVAQDIGATAIAAVTDIEDTLQAQSELILADLQNLISIATNYLDELNACWSSIKSFLSCIALDNLIPSVTTLISNISTTVSADIKALSDEFATFTSSLTSLKTVTAIADLQSAMEESIAEVETCVAALITVS